MKNQSVREWLRKCYPDYDGNVTVSSVRKKTERKIVEDHRDLSVSVPPYSYKRYGFALSHIVAQKFVQAIGALRFGFHARLTNCGMAAIATALNAVDGRFLEKIFVGEISYPETRHLFDSYPNKVVSYGSSDKLMKLLDKKANKPSLIFFETVGNGQTMPALDVKELFEKCWKRDVTIILDNTLLTCCILNPFEIYNEMQTAKGRPTMQLIYIESLSKYYRADENDLVTAGIIVGPKVFISDVDKVVMCNGTYLPFLCLCELPFDLFAACQKIMPLLCKNTKKVAIFLRQHPKVSEVSYPNGYFPKGVGGVLYFVVDTDHIEEVSCRMNDIFGPYKGSFGHPYTSWVPFGKFFKDVPKGLIRLAVGSQEHPENIISRLTNTLS